MNKVIFILTLFALLSIGCEKEQDLISNKEYSEIITVKAPDALTDDRDGQSYPLSKLAGSWWTDNINHESQYQTWCYEQNSSQCARNGRLYSAESALKACPKGTHLASLKEWEDIIKLDWSGANN